MTPRSPTLSIEFRQHDFIPGFAAFLPDATPQGPAYCVLNVGDLLATVVMGDAEPADLPYVIAECMMHEAMHALEAWAGVEFSEARIEALIKKYQDSDPVRLAAAADAAKESTEWPPENRVRNALRAFCTSIADGEPMPKPPPEEDPAAMAAMRAAILAYEGDE